MIKDNNLHERMGKLQGWWTVVNGMPLFMRLGDEPVPADRPHVVLVHGLSVSSRYMIPTARQFAPHYHVYAPDFPGFGNSPKPQHVLDIPELAAVLHAWLQAMGLRRVAMIGNSLGCQVIVDFALRYPEHLDRAVLIGPTMDRYARTVRQQFGRLLLDSVREPPSQPFVVGYDYLKTGLRRTLQTLRYGLADQIEAKLPRVNVPMIVQRGGRDPIVSQRWAEEVAGLLPQGQLVVFSTTAHTANYSAPLELLHLLRPFLDNAKTG